MPPTPDAACALALLANPILDPFFRPAARSGLASAWHTHVPFAQWLVSAARPRLIVELGTHNGISYAAFCETVLQERLATRCYAVDNWAGDDHAGYYDESVYAELRAFHDGRYSAFSELLRMTFDEAREVIGDATVDLLHIDGFHSYDAVCHDFESWMPKLSPRAVVLFHDINVLERGFGVVRFWAEVAARFPSFSFLHGHGLGVLAVGPDVPPAVGRLCAMEASAVAVLRERFAALGRAHGLDYALRETARHEQRLSREATERDGAVESLRRSLNEVLRHRDDLLAAKALADQHLPVQEATVASLRQALGETQSSLDDARDRAARAEGAVQHQSVRLAEAMEERARLEVAVQDRARLETAAQARERQLDEGDRIIGDLRAQAAEDKVGLDRLQIEIGALRGHLAAARADVKVAREDERAEAGRLQAEIATRDHALAALESASEAELSAPRAGFGLRPRRH
jgi:hypothetical protein